MSEIQNTSSQLMSYPVDGTRKKGAKSGRWTIDFNSGLATDKDGNSEPISKSLAELGKNFARSCFITVSTVDAIIKIGQNTLPKSHQLTYVINGISFEQLTIEFPTDRTPKDDFSFAVIGSDSPVFPIQADSLIGFHTPTPQTGTTTDSYVKVFDFLFTGYLSSEIIIENTGGTNVATVDIQVSEDGVNFVSAQSYPLDIAINDYNIFQNTISHRFIRVRIKSKTTGLSTTFRVQLNLER